MGKLLKMEFPAPADMPANESIAAEEERGLQLQLRIARNLRAYRNIRGLDVDSLARQSHVEPEALREAESGEAMPSLGLLWKVARVLDVSCLALTGEADEPVPSPLQLDFKVNAPAR